MAKSYLGFELEGAPNNVTIGPYTSCMLVRRVKFFTVDTRASLFLDDSDPHIGEVYLLSADVKAKTQDIRKARSITDNRQIQITHVTQYVPVVGTDKDVATWVFATISGQPSIDCRVEVTFNWPESNGHCSVRFVFPGWFMPTARQVHSIQMKDNDCVYTGPMSFVELAAKLVSD
jgi:hypothetical protein